MSINVELTCPNGHTHTYEQKGAWTTDMAWEEGTPDPNVHWSYYSCRTCDVDFMLVSKEYADGIKTEIRPSLPLGKYIAPPK